MTSEASSAATAPYYLIFDADIHDSDRFRTYKELVQPLLEDAGGRFIVQGGTSHVYEGDWNPPRIAVLEFPSQKAWEAFYFSEEYEPIKEIRHQASTGSLVGFEGLTQADEKS
ncbi:DUF1330 domain-containing protein [Amycolatopsis lurida]